MRFLAVLAIVAVSTAPTASAQDWSWKGRLRPGQTVEIKDVNGNIRAVLASGNEISVTATKRAERDDPAEVTIQVVEHADGVTICAVYPTPRRSRQENSCEPGDAGHMNTENNDVRVTFTVAVPVGIKLDASTVNGDVDVASLKSDVYAHAVNGSVKVSTSGLVEAGTVNGSLDITMGRSDWTGELAFETVNGGITLYLPDPLHTEVSASTVNGDIETDWPLTVLGRISPHRMRGTIGNGGRRLHLGSVNGSIAIRKASS